MISLLAGVSPSGNWVRVIALVSCGSFGIAVMTCALYGWGRLTRRLAGLLTGTWPVSMSLGLASVLFLGGLLNLFHIAYPEAFAGVVIVGLTLTAFALRQDDVGPQQSKHGRVVDYIVPGDIAIIAVITALTGFMIATQLGPSLYNGADDFQKYFAHAIRMIETGSLYGSPLNALGGESLGGQAFLQGFVVSFFPLRYINSVDAVFCFFLCLTLIGGIAIGRPQYRVAALVGTLAVFIIDPKQINVSSLYSMAAVISGLIILRVDPRENGDATAPFWRQAAAPALFYAGAIALKHTGIVFLSLQFGFSVVASCWVSRDWRRSLLSAGWIVIWTMIFVAPWLLLYAPYYVAALTHPIGAPLTATPAVQDSRILSSLFSPKEDNYGASELAYTCLAAGLFLCALYSGTRARVEITSRRSLVEFASACAAAVTAYLFWALAGPLLIERTTALRFSIPVTIGAASAALPLWAVVTGRRSMAACVAYSALLIFVFASPTHERVATLLRHRSALAYLHHWHIAALDRARYYQDQVLNGDVKAEVQHLQKAIPPGEALLAWTDTPFLLDFRRNNIIDANVDGLSQPWGRISPPSYVLWQFLNRDGTRSAEESYRREIAAFGRRTGNLDARAIDVLDWLQNISAHSEIIGYQDGMIIFQVNKKALLPPN
jgi:hypothetical protein